MTTQVVNQAGGTSVIATTTENCFVVSNDATAVVLAMVGAQGAPGADGDANTFESENKSGGTLAAGVAVATHSSGTGTVKAIATAFSTLAIGLVAASTANGVSGDVQTTGPFTLADWTAITGTAELVARGRYYLSASTAGLLTTTAPSTVGQILQLVGVAISPTTLDIDPGEGILL